VRTRRVVVLLVIACLLRAAVPFVAGSTMPVEARGTGSYACRGHVCGCRTEDDCRRACCCTPSKHRRAPSTPVYSPCGGGGPQAIADGSSLVAVLPAAFVGAAKRARFAPCAIAVPVLAEPSLEPSTPPPRGAFVGI
jgi:hypothetical protein